MLYLVSVPYQLITQIRNYCYKNKIFKTYKISKPVISVGNISVGGTGKTPFCIELLQICLSQQLLPALVSRGYGNDESKIYEKRFSQLPMMFSPNRIKACNDLLQSNPNISLFVLDDAFQHQKIYRDLNILLINATDPFGQNYCLPRGFLRESLTSMNRAQIIILTHADEISTIEKERIISKIDSIMNKKTPIIEAKHEPDYLLSPTGEKINISELSDFQFKKIGLLCGIANPEGFVVTLKKCNLNPEKLFIFPDHYQYLTNDFKIISQEKKLFDCLITTEKDIVKISLETKMELNIFTLIMKIKLFDEDKVISLIKEISK